VGFAREIKIRERYGRYLLEFKIRLLNGRYFEHLDDKAIFS
jgi:hypothetical protein